MIGIFDSGLGGFTVVKAILKKAPNISVLYFGDTARFPYGTKSKKIVLKYSKENTDFLIKKGAKAIIIACNTSSAVATNFLKKKFKAPIFDVTEPTAKAAVAFTKKQKIGIIATPLTIKSKAYQNKIKKLSKGKIKIYTKACPLLVPLIEKGLSKNKITKDVLKKYLESLKKKDIDVLILGCTHYSLIKNLILKEIGKNVKIIDSAKAVANEIRKVSKNKKYSSKKTIFRVFLSDESYNFEKISKRVFGKKIFYKIV